jgi:hypothetical protein
MVGSGEYGGMGGGLSAFGFFYMKKSAVSLLFFGRVIWGY